MAGTPESPIVGERISVPLDTTLRRDSDGRWTLDFEAQGDSADALGRMIDEVGREWDHSPTIILKRSSQTIGRQGVTSVRFGLHTGPDVETSALEQLAHWSPQAPTEKGARQR